MLKKSILLLNHKLNEVITIKETNIIKTTITEVKVIQFDLKNYNSLFPARYNRRQ